MSKKSTSEIFSLLLNTDGDSVLSVGPTDHIVDLKALREIFEMVGPSAKNELLPPVVRSFSNDMTKFFVERNPFQININYSPYTVLRDGDSAITRQDPKDFEIWLPWTYYMITLAGPPTWSPVSVNMYFRTRQVFSDLDLLIPAKFPNFDNCIGTVCIGNTSWAQAGRNYTIAGAISEAINGIWTAGFNADMGQSTISTGIPSLAALARTMPISDYTEKVVEGLLEGVNRSDLGEEYIAERKFTHDVHLLDVWSKLDLKDVLNFELSNAYLMKMETILSQLAHTQAIPEDASGFANWIYRSTHVPAT